MVKEVEGRATNKRIFFNLLLGELSSGKLDPDNFEVTPQLLEQILDHDENWLDPIARGITCVETNGAINPDGVIKSKRRYQKLRKKPLKGLKKVHLRPLSLQSHAKNLKIKSKLNSDKNFPEIIENDPEKLRYDFVRTHLEIKNSSTNKYESFLSLFLKYKNSNNLHTGDWLLYGELDSKRYYLMVYDGDSHSSDEADSIVFSNLLNIYGKAYLDKFLKD